MTSANQTIAQSKPVENQNGPLIRVLKEELWRKQGKIRRTEEEIWRIKNELLELGVKLPPGD